MAVSTLTMLCSHHHCLILELSYYLTWKPLTNYQSTPSPQPLEFMNLPSVEWPFLKFSYKWNSMICSVLCSHNSPFRFKWNDWQNSREYFTYCNWCWKHGLCAELNLQFSSVAQSCPTLCHPMDCSIPGFPVLHYFPEFAQTHIHWVSDAIWPFHPLPPSSPFAFSLSQHQDLFQWVSCSHQVTKVLELQLQHQFFQWIFRTDFL